MTGPRVSLESDGQPFRTVSPRAVQLETQRSDYMGRSYKASDHAPNAEENDNEPGPASGTWSRFVLREGMWARIVWSFLEGFLVFYTASVWLYRFTFEDLHFGADGVPGPRGKTFPWLDVVGSIVDGFWVVDLLLNFFISYRDRKGNEVTSLRLIARNYMHFFFWINLFACVPESLLELLTDAVMRGHESDRRSGFARGARALRLIRLFKLARLIRLSNAVRIARVLLRIPQSVTALANLDRQLSQHVREVRIIRFVFSLTWLLHILACLWYLCATLQRDLDQTWVAKEGLLGEDPILQWLRALCWVFCMVFLAFGVADIGMSYMEMVFCLSTMTFGAIVNSIIISEVIGIVTSKDEVQQVINKQLCLIETFAAHTSLDQETMRSVKTEIAWRVKSRALHASFDKHDMQELLTSEYVPRWLLSRMQEGLFGGELLRNEFVHGVKASPPRMVPLLAVHVQRSDFCKGEIVYEMSEFAMSVFLVLNGTFAYVGRPGPGGGMSASISEEENLYPYMLFSRRSYFGQEDLLMGRLRTATARCERDGTLLALPKQDFLELQEMFPTHAVVWKQTAIRREWLRQKSLQRLTHSMTLKSLAATMIQEYFRRKHGRSSKADDKTQPTGLRADERWRVFSAMTHGLSRTAQIEALQRVLEELKETPP